MWADRRCFLGAKYIMGAYVPQHLYEPECVFCEIAAGELPARFLYADGTVVSFLDDELVAVRLVARKVAVALREVLASPGMWLHHVSGEAAGQDVFHYHLHLIPRYDDDVVQPGWGAAPWCPPEVSEGDLDTMAALVAEKLRAPA